MTESEGEIECLDEDADIVFQCLQYAHDNVKQIIDKNPNRKYTAAPVKRKRDLSHYNPIKDNTINKWRKLQSPSHPVKVVKQPRTEGSVRSLGIDDFNRRKKLNIIIPDFEDPLCIPVKAVVKNNFDQTRLRHWNNQCLAQMRERSDNLKTSRGEAVSSSRTTILKKNKNKMTGNCEISVKTKTQVMDESGQTLSEIFQCILPHYREKKELMYWITEQKGGIKKATPRVSTVILTKEPSKEGDQLVVYKPEEAVSAIYTMVDTPQEEASAPSRYRRHLHEACAVRACAACHHASSRPHTYNDNTSMDCTLCGRHFVSVYNYLTHLKTHAAADVAHYAHVISQHISEVLQYHYKCRICQQQFPLIKMLRNHVKSHRCPQPFLCEIGNHIVK